MANLEYFLQKILQFRDARNWRQFHNPKDSALSLSLEATEVLEHFQWKNGEELDTYIREHKNELADELIDVLYWVLLMCHDLGINIEQAFERKMQENEMKYPVEKASGVAKKYTEL